MKVYSQRKSRPFKWVLGIVLFIVVMTFTLAEVHGSPTTGQDGQTYSANSNTGNDQDVAKSDGSNGAAGNDDPSEVPEPGTLLLMAAGLGTAYFVRKSRKTTTA